MAKKKKEKKLITTFDTHQPQVVPLDQCYFTGTDPQPFLKSLQNVNSRQQQFIVLRDDKGNVTGYSSEVRHFIQPRMDYLLVDPDPIPGKTNSGIWLPGDAAKSVITNVFGTVLLTGPGLNNQYMNVQPGDKITYPKYAGTEIIINDHEYLMIRWSDCYGTIKQLFNLK